MSISLRKLLVAVCFCLYGTCVEAQDFTLLETGVTSQPVGWVEFCKSHVSECVMMPSSPRTVRLNTELLWQLNWVNAAVNKIITPMTDEEHWGEIERWSYPDDLKGDCEDYVLLKRRALMSAGWPREALLITVVYGKVHDGHAVLTVMTDRGEYILDNQVAEIVPWYKAAYRFSKRQSQQHPDVWMGLSDPRSYAMIWK